MSLLDRIGTWFAPEDAKDYETAQMTVDDVDEQERIGWWEGFKRAIMPESRAEHLANEMMKTPANQPFHYDADDDFSSPNIFVEAKGAVKELISDAKMNIVYIFIGVAILIFLYSAGAALVRR